TVSARRAGLPFGANPKFRGGARPDSPPPTHPATPASPREIKTSAMLFARLCRKPGLEIERENLTSVQKPFRIERRLDPHLLDQIGFGILVAHQIPLLDPHTMFPGQASAGIDAEFEQLGPAFLGSHLFALIIGVVKNERVEIA